MDRNEIEARIAELRAELARVEGGPTEVYSRIVGYYRSVRNWNAGKRDEYGLRRTYAMTDGRDFARKPTASRDATVEERERTPSTEVAAVGREILVFTRETCPNCSPVANYVIGAGVPATFVDVDRAEGLELARRHNVLATPTVLGIDPDGREAFRAFAVHELKARLAPATAT